MTLMKAHHRWRQALDGITKFTKTFTNSEALLAEKTRGVSRRLVGFHLIDRGIPRQGYPITNAQGGSHWHCDQWNHVAVIESSHWHGLCPQSPYLRRIRKFSLRSGGKLLQAKVTKLPFYQG